MTTTKILVIIKSAKLQCPETGEKQFGDTDNYEEYMEKITIKVKRIFIFGIDRSDGDLNYVGLAMFLLSLEAS